MNAELKSWMIVDKGLTEEWARSLAYMASRIIAMGPTGSVYNVEDARAVAASILTSNTSHSSIRGQLYALEYWMEWIQHPVKFKKPRTPQRCPQYLGVEQMRAILDAANNPRDKAIVATFLFTGARRNEVRMLDIADLDFANKTVRFRVAKLDKAREVP